MFPPIGFLNLPNVATSLSAVAGLCAIIAASRGALPAALSFLCGAVLLDKLDGLLARRLGRTTEFGRELDSLADALSFCVAPALIGHFGGIGIVGTGCAVVYCVAGFWRLAYFNITGMKGDGDDARFTGVPTTVAASWFLIARVALVRAPAIAVPLVLSALYLGLALLMVSAVSFRKNGLLVKSLYILLPLSVALAWTL